MVNIQLLSHSSRNGLVGILKVLQFIYKFIYSSTWPSLTRCWSLKRGTAIIGTPFQNASWVLSNPEWLIKARVFSWASISFCGSHDLVITFFGKRSFILSDSNFHMKLYSGIERKASINLSKISSANVSAWNIDPMTKRMAPFLLLSIKSEMSWNYWNLCQY